MTLEHHYHHEYFNQTIDFQLSELKSRFSEDSVRLLQLIAALDPRSSFRSFSENDIPELAENFYPQDFDACDRHTLRSELPFYSTQVVQNLEFHVPTLAELMEKLVETGMDVHFKMISRLIRLVLTLPVSTATTERAFSAMKYVKNDLRNRMANEFLADALTMYIEREYALDIDFNSVIDEFASSKERRVQLTF
ncbi:hypothetical protein LINGRAHAP2_LOCUS20052 [Linum grandiflorum]